MTGQDKNTSSKGAIFKQKVRDAKLSLAEFAAMAHVSPQVVYGWSKRGVPARAASRAACILRCDAQEISHQDPGLGGQPNAVPGWAFDRFPAHIKKPVLAPIIPWHAASDGEPAQNNPLGFAVCFAEPALPVGCFALLGSRARGLAVDPVVTGMAVAMFVDPGRRADAHSEHGHIVQTPSTNGPVLRHIEKIGNDVFLVGACREYPVTPERLTPDCKIIGAVVAVGLAAAIPEAIGLSPGPAAGVPASPV